MIHQVILEKRHGLELLLCLLLASFPSLINSGPVLDSSPPINPKWVVEEVCQYGNIPGSWVAMPIIKLVPWVAKYSLPYTNSTVKFGDRWRTLDKSCQLDNLVDQYLNFTGPRNTTERIVMLGDSTDTHILEYFNEHHGRMLNRSHPAQYTALQPRSRLHDRGPQLNYMMSTAGLDLFQMFIQGVRPDTESPMLRVNVTRNTFTSLTGGAEPDLVIFLSNYWDLHHMVLTHKDATLMDAQYLPMSFIDGWMDNATALLQHIRAQFPESPIVYHTAIITRHNATSGDAMRGGRGWTNKMWVSQLNAAGRQVARALNIPIVDYEVIAAGLTPYQALFDEIHPADWITWEFINIQLNFIRDYKRVRAQRVAMPATS